MRISRAHLLTIVRSALDASPKLVLTSSHGERALSEQQRDELVRWTRASTTPQRVVTRSTIVLLAAAGWPDARIAAQLGVTRRTVSLWRLRFAETGSRGILTDAPGRGRKPGRDAALIERVLAMTAQPPVEGQRWTVRSLARAAGVSHATVQRIWKEHGTEPARKVS
jgi:transposase